MRIVIFSLLICYFIGISFGALAVPKVFFTNAYQPFTFGNGCTRYPNYTVICSGSSGGGGNFIAGNNIGISATNVISVVPPNPQNSIPYNYNGALAGNPNLLFQAAYFSGPLQGISYNSLILDGGGFTIGTQGPIGVQPLATVASSLYPFYFYTADNDLSFVSQEARILFRADQQDINFSAGRSFNLNANGNFNVSAEGGYINLTSGGAFEGTGFLAGFSDNFGGYSEIGFENSGQGIFGAVKQYSSGDSGSGYSLLGFFNETNIDVSLPNGATMVGITPPLTNSLATPCNPTFTDGLLTNNGIGCGSIQSSSTTNGFLSSTDWNTFNNKVSATPSNVASITGQSGAVSTICTNTPSSLGQYTITGYVTITAVTTDVVNMQVSYIDETGTKRTQSMFPMGTTSASLATTGAYQFPTFTIRSSPNAITVNTILTTGIGSVSYDAGCTITRLSG